MQISPAANGEEEAVATIRKKRNYVYLDLCEYIDEKRELFVTKIDGVEIIILIIIKIIKIISTMFYYNNKIGRIYF